jgi:deazaflavin-dependent oxidoreductase (nitroreductase family)
MPGRNNALLRRLGHQKWLTVLGRWLMPVDRWLQRTTRGRLTILGHNVVPQLLLTTTGRQTGQARVSPLLYACVEDDWVVTASNWGQAHQPAWSSNLIANPDAVIEIGREHIDVRATLADGDERERLWAAALDVWPAYDTYAERSGRDIRVFRLHRR